MSVPLFIVEGDQCSRKFTTWFAVGLPPGPAASTLARGGLLEQYRCTWGGLDGGVGGRVRVSFLSLPFPAALAVGNFHGTSLLPWGLGYPVGSTKRCFHGFVPLVTMGRYEFQSIRKQIWKKEAGARYKQLSAAFFLPSKSLRRSNGLHRYPYRASMGTGTFERKPHSRTVVESWDVYANLGNSSAFRMQNPDLPGYPPRTSRPPLVPFVDAPRESATDRAEGRRISI
ncbi:hypothetical protein CSIM01_08335 [Colletotrichum simmondsii]|uniref:Uncharacterized protein n=1 Tax=Colletotrichum simmondsii TaxID=703756 RepID=A0A135RYG3_9PEZI|nr:hypothetical protein CSIM01_08335 [Colletotrichum simmondsii]